MGTLAMSTAALNRALLARQMLLRRQRVPPLAAIERLVGMQAQEARPPFVGLWARVVGFKREQLHRLFHNRSVVRATAMRCTIHLLSTRDYLRFRAALQPALTAALRSLGERTVRIDIDRLVKIAREHLDASPCTFEAIRTKLESLGDVADVRAAAYAIRTHLPLVQVPSDATWGYDAAADFALAERWLSAPLHADGSPDELILRYLAAFGPATPSDAQTWSGLRAIAPVFERLRRKLRVFQDPRGRELFDLPRAPRPPENVDAPVRLLPEFDNHVLSHTDRSRVIRDEHRKFLSTMNGRVPAVFLIDGMAEGSWSIERSKHRVVLRIEPFESMPKRGREELNAEAEALLAFLHPETQAREIAIAARRAKIPKLRRA
jgi:hypothetical protein